MKRLVLVAAMDADLQRVVLVVKNRPEWQAGKANFPGGKVEESDFGPGKVLPTRGLGLAVDPDYLGAYRNAGSRELREETGLDVPPEAMHHVATIACESGAELVLLACRADVGDAETLESEPVFDSEVDRIAEDGIAFPDAFKDEAGTLSFLRTTQHPFYAGTVTVDVMYNLPWLVVMARECLRGTPGFPVHMRETRAPGPSNEAP